MLYQPTYNIQKQRELEEQQGKVPEEQGPFQQALSNALPITTPTVVYLKNQNESVVSIIPKELREPGTEDEVGKRRLAFIGVLVIVIAIVIIVFVLNCLKHKD